MTPLDNRPPTPFFPCTSRAGQRRRAPFPRALLLALSLALLPALNGCFGDDQKTSGPPPAPVRTAAVARAIS